MLAKLSSALTENAKVILNKTADGVDASLFGAFRRTSVLKLNLQVPRVLGVSLPRLRIAKDGENEDNLPFTYITTYLGSDIYEIELDLAALCGKDASGLFYYDIVFPRGDHSLYSDTRDNQSITLSEEDGAKFRLLIYEDDFDTPQWFRGGIMYHIFVDRFAKGSLKPICRDDAEMNEDWENGIPQYGEYPGAFVKNNVFFGGNLVGVREKLDYLEELGVSVIYLSPIFKAYSNHKYDTGDYMSVDEMFGGECALKELIEKAKSKGIRIILDGVFNHTGDDSKYFNKYGKYESLGAYQSTESEYYNWYHFGNHPNEYLSWWGIPILPKLNHENEACRNYFVSGENSVVGKYTKMGIGGIRLDVADELSDDFLDRLRKTAKDISGNEALIIGEVWENAADKIAYGRRRRYLQGSQLDSVMNYPFRSAAIDYLISGNSSLLASALTELYASYPKCVCDSLMNILGTHDTERILTVLGGDDCYDKSNSELAHRRMDKDTLAHAVKLLKIASVLQYTVYGVPSVFYGDEVGLEGYRDPFCRMPFPWGRENDELLRHYRKLGSIRRSEKLFESGFFRISRAEGAYLEYERYNDDLCITVALNVGSEPIKTELCGKDLLSGKEFKEGDELMPFSFVILK